MSRLCPTYVPPMTRVCPCPICDQHLSSKSSLWLHQIQCLSCWSNLCPQFVISLWTNWQENMVDKTRTKIGLHHFSICHLVTLYLDKSWTFSGLLEGQSLTNFCPNTSCPTYVRLLSIPRNVFLAHRPWPTHSLTLHVVLHMVLLLQASFCLFVQFHICAFGYRSVK